MCLPIAALAVAASSATQAYGQFQEGIANSKYYGYMSEQSRQEGELAVARGQRQSELIQDTASQEGRKLKVGQAGFNASQKAALAAQGVTGVTAQDIVSDTVNQEYLDEQALRYNADTKSYEVTEGAKYQKYAADVQADQYSYASKYAKKAGKMKAFTTLLGTAASTASMKSSSGGGSSKPSGNTNGD